MKQKCLVAITYDTKKDDMYIIRYGKIGQTQEDLMREIVDSLYRGERSSMSTNAIKHIKIISCEVAERKYSNACQRYRHEQIRYG